MASMAQPHSDDRPADRSSGSDDQHSESGQTSEARLHERLAANEKALLETREALVRAVADQENAHKVAARDRDEAVRYAAAQMARDLLESLDNLRRAVESAPQDGSADGLLSGVIATERNLLAALTKHGIRRLDPMGEHFDPKFHEAVYQRAAPDFDSGEVIEVIQPGYMIHDRLLRPAMVGVADNGNAEPSRE